MKFKSLDTRSFRVGGYSVFAGVAVVGIAAAANFFVNALPASLTQLDITSNQLFSISEQTEEILKSLDEEITLYWIVQTGEEDSTIETLLNRYKTLSNKLTVEKKDPDVYPTFAKQYTDEAIYNNSLIAVSGNRSRYISYDQIYQYDYSNYYTTYTYDVSFAGESELTSAIDYLANDELPKTYFLSGHGEKDLNSSFTSSIEKENIQMETLSLISSETIPEDADCLIMLSPQGDIAEQEKDMLLDYLDNGGHLLLVTDLLEEQELTNLEEVMDHYGVSLENGIVVEESQSNYAWGTPYYLLPDFTSHEITQSLIDENYYVLLPISQGLKVSDDLRDGVTVTRLLTTSSASYSKAAGYALETYDKEEGDVDGPFALAVAISEKHEASETNAAETAEELEDTKEIDGEERTESIEKEAKIVWIASSSIVDSQTNQQVSGGNQDFFLNALGWMCNQSSEKLSIRTKTLANEYLTIDNGKTSIFTLFIVGIIPLCYLTVGIRIWIRRKRR